MQKETAIKPKNPMNIDSIIKEADEAMEKFSARNHER